MRMQLLILGCSFLLLTFMVGGCERHSVDVDCSHDATMRTYKQWKGSVRFPSAPRVRQERIVKNFERVGVGSTKEEFVAAFGEPDYEEELYPKEPNRPCKGYEFAYYFEKPDADLANEVQDKRIEAFFSPAGKATWIFSNISGLSEKGSPTIN